ncbi:DUF1232 domain-containing protein [Parerythrobacter aurantius]|uniref:DUF1232 domain-containing protein n=1 Tax=Parerythrobacter aurantius TaxID=3127706 RepID=UPI003247020C
MKREALVVWLAARDRRTPVVCKAVALVVAAYAFSPVDLIPDFIPVLGLLDDLLLVPAGVWLALRLAPTALVEEWRQDAASLAEKPVSRVGVLIVCAVWLGAALACWIAWR